MPDSAAAGIVAAGLAAVVEMVALRPVDPAEYSTGLKISIVHSIAARGSASVVVAGVALGNRQVDAKFY